MADQIRITLPDGKEGLHPAGTVVREILAGLDGEKSRSMVAAKVNGTPVDSSHRLTGDAAVEPIDAASPEGLSILRHSMSHVMAQAVQETFTGVQVSIGPSIEDGFYYDFEYAETFTPQDLEKIEARMREIAAADIPFERREVSRAEAVALFQKKGENYKVELINDLPADVKTVSLYTQNGYVDLCRGPHVPSTGMIRAFKLLNVAGAYWRGDERNKMLQRIYGTGFATQEALDEHLRLLEEAKKRDHRRLGRELDLFQLNDEAGAGLVIWHPKGALLRTIIEDWERKEHLKRGYDIVIGPQILKADLWKRSGHFDHYRENMYFTEVDEQTYGIKPMNCLSHMLIYKSKIRSYRDLPLRYFELGTVHRHEKAGVLHGLMRVRQFTQDDAHILCTPEQLNSEIRAIADFVGYAMGIFGFEYEVELSTRPENSIGSDQDWELATSALRGALKDNGMTYEVNEGDGAFYGPKIDFKLKDALEAEVAVRDHPVRFYAAGAVRSALRRRGWRKTPPGHAPSGDPGRHRTVHGGFDRTLCRGVSALAFARAGRAGDRDGEAYPLGRGGPEAPSRCGHPRGGRFPEREIGLQDPRGSDAENAFHARDRRSGSGLRSGFSTAAGWKEPRFHRRGGVHRPCA